MDTNGLFKKYHTRLVWEGILKALLIGFTVGAAVNAVISLVSWAVGFKEGLWVSIGVGLGVAALVSVLLYFLKYRPTTKEVAERIDALGLEERMITMNELQESTAYMAVRQREDAVSKLSFLSAKSLRLIVPPLAIVFAVIASLSGIGFTTAVALYSADIIGDLPGVVDPLLPETYFEVTYDVFDEQTMTVGMGGTIEYGDPFQVVEAGKDAEAVIAVEEEGWIFLGWYYENGEAAPNWDNPARQDLNIRENLTLYAHFVRTEESEQDEGDGEGDGDAADDEPQEGDSSGDDQDENQPGSSAGGVYEEGNYIKDGETHYKENWDQYYKEMLERLAEDDELTDEMREIIENYFKIIE